MGTRKPPMTAVDASAPINAGQKPRSRRKTDTTLNASEAKALVGTVTNQTRSSVIFLLHPYRAMTSISSVETIVPSSAVPVIELEAEEDLGRTPRTPTSAWTDRPSRKGKQRQLSEDDDSESGDSVGSPSYPPVNDDDEETRRVEQTLKKWEMAERQRRKVARDVAAGPDTFSPSLVRSVARRASLLWAGKHRHGTPPDPSLGAHRALGSTDSINLDGVVLHDVATPTPSPPATRISPRTDDPFSDAHSLPSLMQSPVELNTLDVSENSLLSPSVSSPVSTPLSMPIDEPPPPTSPPRLQHTPDIEPEEKPVPWWHEWLCGCSEDADRGGDRQAGRTNPNE
ncbi:hypothetical protein FISHEDRAFT_61899 [Fistulina hepatica ATCC 64428]|uniref:Uncharacterized protein n=1 Tax=Fistulina hepatica ATCC 64428 TaxID=1128425 RepID=A0A0D7A0P4_9AGAR|nr:hypothetical protein FISHEDRAFT_61899 [Fistulina hepatica ATCC 64428]